MVLEGPEGPWKPWEIFGMTLDQQKRYSRGAQNDLLKKGDIVTLGGGGQPQYLFLSQIYQVSKNIGNSVCMALFREENLIETEDAHNAKKWILIST